jgi:hypothetical protein
MEKREKCKKGKGKRRVKRKKEREKMETARENRKKENLTMDTVQRFKDNLQIFCMSKTRQLKPQTNFL